MLATLDERIVVVFNQWLSQQILAYELSWWLVQSGIWLFAVTLLVMLWFSGNDDHPNAAESSRGQHRQYVVGLLLAGIVAFLTARGIAAGLGRTPPPADVLFRQPPQTLSATYPASVASFWFALVPGFAVFYGGRMSLTAVLFGVLVSVLAVATGLHYPSDVLAGAFLGAVIGMASIFLLPTFTPFYRSVVLGFQVYPLVLYPLGAGLLLDATTRFQGVMTGTEWLFRIPLAG